MNFSVPKSRHQYPTSYTVCGRGIIRDPPSKDILLIQQVVVVTVWNGKTYECGRDHEDLDQTGKTLFFYYLPSLKNGRIEYPMTQTQTRCLTNGPKLWSLDTQETPI